MFARLFGNKICTIGTSCATTIPKSGWRQWRVCIPQAARRIHGRYCIRRTSFDKSAALLISVSDLLESFGDFCGQQCVQSDEDRGRNQAGRKRRNPDPDPCADPLRFYLAKQPQQRYASAGRVFHRRLVRVWTALWPYSCTGDKVGCSRFLSDVASLRTHFSIQLARSIKYDMWYERGQSMKAQRRKVQ